MTRLLEEAFERASELPPSEQDAIAHWLIAELEAEKRWDEALAKSPEKLERLAEQALEEHRQGKTTELDPKSL